MKIVIKTFLTVLLSLIYSASLGAKPLHHYVFFGTDREKIKATKSFLETKTYEGAQVAYSWRQLEREETSMTSASFAKTLSS